jgi:very-short-patch-repair endonuclease
MVLLHRMTLNKIKKIKKPKLKKIKKAGDPTQKKRIYANELRRNLTLPEGMLWKRLKPGFAGVEWHSQSIILGFIADFFCAQKRIVIEIDSSYHNGREAYDKKRDQIMKDAGITVLRVQAKEVMVNVFAVLAKIQNVVNMTKDNLWENKIK